MIKKLRRKFVCINMLIVLLMLIFIFGFTVNMTKRSLESDSLDTLRASYAPEKKEQRPEEKKEQKEQKTNSVNDSGKGRLENDLGLGVDLHAAVFN